MIAHHAVAVFDEDRVHGGKRGQIYLHRVSGANRSVPFFAQIRCVTMAGRYVSQVRRLPEKILMTGGP